MEKAGATGRPASLSAIKAPDQHQATSTDWQTIIRRHNGPMHQDALSRDASSSSPQKLAQGLPQPHQPSGHTQQASNSLRNSVHQSKRSPPNSIPPKSCLQHTWPTHTALHKTIRVYVAGLRLGHILRGLPDPTQDLMLANIQAGGSNANKEISPEPAYQSQLQLPTS